MKLHTFVVAAAAVASLAATAAHAAVLIAAPPDIVCQAQSCTGVQRGVAGSTPITIDAFSFRRDLLGALGHELVHVTFWANGGQTLLGDFGDYSLSVLGGDVLTLKGPAFRLDPGAGDLTFRFDLVDLTGGGGAGGGGWGFGLGGPPHGPRSSVSVGGDALDFDTPSGGGENLFTFAADASTIPEASSWALMLTGLAGLGGTYRWRRRLAAATA